MQELTYELAQQVVQPRCAQTHKGDYGRVLLIGGCYPYGGAIIMAALACVNSGAGLVTVATERENIAPLHTQLPEAMAFDLCETALLSAQLKLADVVLIGSGMADNQITVNSLQLILREATANQVVICDGGAIRAYSWMPSVTTQATLVLTPHQKEWEVLSGIPVAQQNSQLNQQAVNQLPKGSIVVCKQHHSMILQAGSDVGWYLMIGGPHQAIGGMGDTLAGMVAAFVAQFKQASLKERVAAATYLHSYIADELAKSQYIVLPTQISQVIPYWLKQLSLMNQAEH